ncbi:MAG: alpha/beta hydrolase [Anaerolineales bacterium]|nr:alpha/beta hydrolase [Anaerolineales bacterium]
MSIPLEHHRIITNGIRLHVVIAGPPGGKVVILLHGFPEFWRGWLKQIEPLVQAGYRLVVPDQRGYNLSDKPQGVSAYHIDTLAQDVIGLMDVVGQEKAVVIGHDWGAAVAWHLATHYPERVEKLAILNVPHPAIMVQTLRTSLTQLLKSWYMFFFQLPWLPEWLLGRNNAQGAAELLRRSGKPGTFTYEDLAEYRQACTQPGALTAMINWYRSSIRSGFGNSLRASRELPRIKVPTLMLWGKQDVALSHEMAQPSIDLCDDGKLVFFEDATHWLQHDKADEVNEQLLRFLNPK